MDRWSLPPAISCWAITLAAASAAVPASSTTAATTATTGPHMHAATAHAAAETAAPAATPVALVAAARLFLAVPASASAGQQGLGLDLAIEEHACGLHARNGGRGTFWTAGTHGFGRVTMGPFAFAADQTQ
jgi:hypothetical protein